LTNCNVHDAKPQHTKTILLIQALAVLLVLVVLLTVIWRCKTCTRRETEAYWHVLTMHAMHLKKCCFCSEALRPAQFAQLRCCIWGLSEAPAVLLVLDVMVVIEVEDVIQVVMFDVVVWRSKHFQRKLFLWLAQSILATLATPRWLKHVGSHVETCSTMLNHVETRWSMLKHHLRLTLSRPDWLWCWRSLRIFARPGTRQGPQKHHKKKIRNHENSNGHVRHVENPFEIILTHLSECTCWQSWANQIERHRQSPRKLPEKSNSIQQ
jgi:hypothetical protein